MTDDEETITNAGADIALTLWPEWAWTITHLDKDLENRGYNLLARDRRLRATGRLWIHAGKTIGGGEMREPDAWAGVIEMAEHAGWTYDGRAMVFHKDGIAVPLNLNPPRGALVAVTRIGIVHGPNSQRTQWKVGGSFGHVLTDTSVLRKPIPCKGAQGLWSVWGQLRKTAA